MVFSVTRPHIFLFVSFIRFANHLGHILSYKRVRLSTPAMGSTINSSFMVRMIFSLSQLLCPPIRKILSSPILFLNLFTNCMKFISCLRNTSSVSKVRYIYISSLSILCIRIVSNMILIKSSNIYLFFDSHFPFVTYRLFSSSNLTLMSRTCTPDFIWSIRFLF